MRRVHHLANLDGGEFARRKSHQAAPRLDAAWSRGRCGEHQLRARTWFHSAVTARTRKMDAARMIMTHPACLTLCGRVKASGQQASARTAELPSNARPEAAVAVPESKALDCGVRPNDHV